MSQSHIYALVIAIIVCLATSAFADISQCKVNTVKGFHVDVNPLRKVFIFDERKERKKEKEINNM